MSLRATKTLACTPLGCLNCIKQGLGVEKRVSATYVPLQFNLGDMGSVLGPELITLNLILFWMGLILQWIVWMAEIWVGELIVN